MILIYLTSQGGHLKKSSNELFAYAKALSERRGDEFCALGINCYNYSELMNFGASKIYDVRMEALKDFEFSNYAKVIAEVAERISADIVLTDSSYPTRAVASCFSVISASQYVSNILSLPENLTPFEVKRTCFSGKAEVLVEINSPKKTLGIAPNIFTPQSLEKQSEVVSLEISRNDFRPPSHIIKKEYSDGKIAIADADIVVSGGKGLKGPENWSVIEDFAEVVGGALACTKAVSDLGWRPHSEHVGQTGKLVASNMYIAVGISGAIQHLAGISGSRIKVVINKDPEAPFFKVADYGVVGDALEILPELTRKLKAIL